MKLLLILTFSLLLVLNIFSNIIARMINKEYWRQAGLDLTSFTYLRKHNPTTGGAVIELIMNSLFFFWGYIIRLQFWYHRNFK